MWLVSLGFQIQFVSPRISHFGACQISIEEAQSVSKRGKPGGNLGCACVACQRASFLMPLCPEALGASVSQDTLGSTPTSPQLRRGFCLSQEPLTAPPRGFSVSGSPLTAYVASCYSLYSGFQQELWFFSWQTVGGRGVQEWTLRGSE